MSRGKCIAIDAMGGEGGLAVTLPASLQALKYFGDLHLTLVGDEAAMAHQLKDSPLSCRRRVQLLHADDTIKDCAPPASALRSGKQSSMTKAVEMVESGEASAMVSAGNTGALLLIGRHLLKTIEGIDKPAMVARIPGSQQMSYLLDVGANPQCSAQQLFQFAVMGSVLYESLNPGAKARIGLLNIGEESYKGTEEVQQASQIIEQCDSLNYIGFIEGNALYTGAADVVVCDGFVGNVTIKSSAGVANVIHSLLTDVGPSALSSSGNDVVDRLGKRLKQLQQKINPSYFNGASLLGLQGSIIKSHSNASVEGFYFAIQQAINEVKYEVPDLISKRVSSIMQQQLTV